MSMKTGLHLIALISIAWSMAAQDDPARIPPGAEARRIDRLGEILGREVKNFQNELLGNVRELAVHLASGEIAEVLVSNPGYLGTADTWIGVPPNEVCFDVAAQIVRLNATREQMKLEPRLESWQWVPFTRTNRMDAVYQYRGGRAFRERRFEDRVAWGAWRFEQAEADTGLAAAAPRRIPSPNWAAYLGYLERASTLKGVKVKNFENTELGRIEDLVMDLGSGKVVAAVVSSGEFLGITDELSPIPLQALRLADVSPLELDPQRAPFLFADHNQAVPERAFLVEISKNGLEAAPHFSRGNWPVFTPEYIATIHAAYRVGAHAAINRITKSVATAIKEGRSAP